MRKQLIFGIAIASAFVIGVLSANPVVEAVGGWQLAIQGLDTRITDLESSVGNPIEMQVELASEAGVRADEFWALDSNPNTDFFSASPATISFGPATITSFELGSISPVVTSVDVRVYLDGNPTSLVCTVPAGETECSVSGGSVPAPIGSLIAMKSEGPDEGPVNSGTLFDPTALVTMQLG